SAKLSELGVDIIPIDMLALDQAQLTDPNLHSEVYWSYGQKILRAAELIKDDPRLFAVYLSNFSCGPDSFLQTFFKDIMANKPSLQLELDEHSADAGVITRLEAFLESLKNYHPAKEQPKQQAAKPKAEVKAVSQQRTWYVPYMGDCAYGIAASFRAYGQPAQVMPVADEEALRQGRQFTTGKECLPCAITAGDMLRVIRAEGFDPDKAAFFMPGSSGPCRFGMYSCLHRLILKYAGAGDVPVISPNQDGSFYRELAGSLGDFSTNTFMKDVWISSVGVDLLFKVLLKLRPFAADRAHAQQLYDKSLKRWVQAIEERNSLPRLKELMESIAEDFASLELDKRVQKPRIGIVGEIYVRNHPFANRNVIARLEELGAACELASVAEWIYYTNFTRRHNAARQGNLRDWFTNLLQDYVQHRLEKQLAEPLEKKFGKLAEQRVEHTVRLARPYIHHSFEGEAVLSVGKIIEYHHQGIGGVVNAMPFTCMPSIIVSTQTMRLSADCGNMPILNLSFDGQEDSTFITRLEAFVEQVRQRQSGCVGVAEIMTVS
ncbi:MAG: CoA activase, partial [Planctomycetota bacterium]|nr:CoA activase [Planctomycetota bacterium]